MVGVDERKIAVVEGPEEPVPKLSVHVCTLMLLPAAAVMLPFDKYAVRSGWGGAVTVSCTTLSLLLVSTICPS